MENKTIITISRQYASGGRTIGKLLSETLGVPFYDNDIITLAAKESGIGEVYFKEAETIAKSSINLSISMLSPSRDKYGMPLNEKVYVTQSKVIQSVAAKGGCVIVGRCADYVLSHSRHNAINIFIQAPIEERVKRAVNEYEIPAENAESYIKKLDKQRANYYNYFTNRHWGDAQNYNLVIDSGCLGVEKSAELIRRFVELKEKA